NFSLFSPEGRVEGWEKRAGVMRGNGPRTPQAHGRSAIIFANHAPTRREGSLIAQVLNRDFVLKQLEDVRDYLTTAATDDRRRGGGEDVAVTDVSLPGWQPRRDEDNRRIFDKFSITDIRWVSSLFAMGVRKFKGRHAFPEKPADPITIGNQARLVVVGDW